MRHERLGAAQQALGREKAEYVEVALLLRRTGQVRGRGSQAGSRPKHLLSSSLFAGPLDESECNDSSVGSPLRGPCRPLVRTRGCFEDSPLAEKVLALTVQLRQEPG